MLRFAKSTRERIEKSVRAHGDAREIFLLRNRVGRIHKIQFCLVDDAGSSTQYAWCFDATVPEARVKSVRDELVRLVNAGEIENSTRLEALRLAVKKRVQELAVEDARRTLAMV